jgi:selenide,water dikinase
VRRERKKIKLLSPSFHPSFVTQSSRAEGGPLLDATRALPLRFEMMETYELLLLGGGHAHVMTLRRWEKRRAPSSSSSTSSALPSAPASPPLQQRPRLALVSSSPASCYSGMLPGVIAGLYAPEQALVPLAPRCAAAGFDLIVAKVKSVSSRRKEVEVEVEDDGGAGSTTRMLRLGYETLSLNVGSTASGNFEVGTSKRSIAAKPAHSLLERLQPLFDACEAASAAAPSSPAASSSSSSSSPPAAALPSVVVVGGGAAGVEIAAAVAARLQRAAAAKKEKEPSPPLVSLVTGPRGLLPEESRSAAALVSRELRRAGVRVVPRGRVVSTPASVFGKEEEEEGKGGGTGARGAVAVEVAVDCDCGGGGGGASPSSSFSPPLLLPADFVLWCTGSAPHRWQRDSTDLELDEGGFIRVDPSLRCRSRPLPSPPPPSSSDPSALPPSVFAAGDCAGVSLFDPPSPPPPAFSTPPKSGVYAVRAGEQVLLPNLLAAVGEGAGGGGDPPPPARWDASREGRPALSLLSLGNGRAVALWPWRWVPAVAGEGVWLLKDFIDRRWVRAAGR